MFVNTCSEKWVVASRVNLELASIHPRPPAVRLFDAGVGDGTVLSRVLRAMHKRFPWMPHYIVAKEISLEDIRLTLELGEGGDVEVDGHRVDGASGGTGSIHPVALSSGRPCAGTTTPRTR